MPDFDWVRARAECSLRKVFLYLITGAKNDTTAREEISQKSGERIHFEASEIGDTLVVTRSEGSALRRVTFILKESSITVEEDRAALFTETPGPNSTADCTLIVEGVELELWKVRRKALERLLFEGNVKDAAVIARK